MGYSFRVAARYLLYTPTHRQRIAHTTAGTLAGSISVGPPRGMDPTTHRTMSGRSATELYLSLRTSTGMHQYARMDHANRMT